MISEINLAINCVSRTDRLIEFKIALRGQREGSQQYGPADSTERDTWTGHSFIFHRRTRNLVSSAIHQTPSRSAYPNRIIPNSALRSRNNVIQQR